MSQRIVHHPVAWLVLLGGLGPGAALAQGSLEPTEQWSAKPTTELALRYADRPLTLPENLFDIRFNGAATQISDEYAVVALGAGAGYGITDDFEIGLSLVRLTLSAAPNTGLDQPTGYLQHRLIDSDFQLAVRGDVELPGSGPIELSFRIPMMVRFGRWVRIDFVPRLLTETTAEWYLTVGLPMEASVQITDALRLGVVAQASIPNVRDTSMVFNAGGQLVYTFGDIQGANAELAFVGMSPALALSGARPQDPAFGNYVQGGVVFRMFFRGPAISTPAFDAFD